MVWVRVDDKYSEHEKIAEVGPLGVSLWLAGLAYCNRNLTDGRIPWAAARSLVSWEYLEPTDKDGKRRVVTISVTSGYSGDDVGSDYVIGLLVAAGLWEEHPGYYYVHDYPDYQPMKETILREREHIKERVKKYRDTHRNTVTNDVSNGVSNAPVTTRPVPVPVNTKKRTGADAPVLPLMGKRLGPYQAMVASYFWTFEKEKNVKPVITPADGKNASLFCEGKDPELMAWLPWEYLTHPTDYSQANYRFSLRDIVMDAANLLGRPRRHPLPKEILVLIGANNGQKMASESTTLVGGKIAQEAIQPARIEPDRQVKEPS